MRSNSLPNAFKLDFFGKVDFFNTVEAKSIVLTWYVKRQFQRSSLTFDLSAKVTHIGGPSIY